MPITIGESAPALAGLSDVSSTAPTEGQVLTRLGPQWQPADPSATGATSLAQLSDVSSAVPTEGQVLTRVGAEWKPATSAAGATSLDQLSDVSASAPTEGQVLTMLNSEWTPAAPVTGSGSTTLGGLMDTSITSPADGQIRALYNGSGKNTSHLHAVEDLSNVHGVKYPLTSATSDSWDSNVASASSRFHGTWAAWKAFDGDNTAGWASSRGRYVNGNHVGTTTTTVGGQSIKGEWLQVSLATSPVATCYKMSIRPSYASQVPTQWVLCARAGGMTGDFTMLSDRRTASDNWSYTEWAAMSNEKILLFDNYTAYKEYRIVFLKLSAHGNAASLFELAICEGVPQDSLVGGEVLQWHKPLGRWIAKDPTHTHATIAATATPTGTTHTVDFDDGNVHTIDLGSATGDVTLTLNSGVGGRSYVIKVIQGATARNLIWPASVKWSGGVAPAISVTSGAVDVVKLIFDGANYYATVVQNFG